MKKKEKFITHELNDKQEEEFIINILVLVSSFLGGFLFDSWWIHCFIVNMVLSLKKTFGKALSFMGRN